MSQVRRESGNNYRASYIDGNTVRKAEPVRQPGRRERVYRDGKRVYESERQIRERERALQMNGVSVAFLAVVSAVCLVMCVVYLHVQSEVSQARDDIAQLKTDISIVVSQNDALNYSINSYVDTENIYKVATKKMGMQQPADKQISYYETSDSGYTVQYGDIPKE